MRRTPAITTPRTLRKAVSFAVVRAFPDAPAKPAKTVEPAPHSAVSRVRDGLVLRVVAKKKSPARKPTDEHGAR